MKLSLNKLKLKQEIDRTEVLLWGVFFFLFLGLFYKAADGGSWLLFIFWVAVLSGYFYLLRRLLKRLYYSFWTFVGVLFVFILVNMFSQPFPSMGFLSFLASGIMLGLQSYYLWTPIFYPIVSWWEYDFRYRDDLKVRVLHDEEKHEARLTDLRRGAGCVAIFKDIPVGEKLLLEPFDDLDDMKFQVEIMSKRKYSFGRPYNYGVRFDLQGSSDEHLFRSFKAFWKNERKIKLKKKFREDHEA